MPSAYSRASGVSSAQPPDPSPEVSQLQPTHPDCFAPRKQGSHCFPLPSVALGHCVRLMWRLSLPGEAPPCEHAQAPRTCGCAQWSGMSQSVYEKPSSSGKNLAEA